MALTVAEQLHREGWMEGVAEGKAEGQIESALMVLEFRFGTVPASIHKKLMNVRESDRIKKIVKLAVTCQTLKEFQKAL